MAQISMTICDVCEDMDKPVQSYTITHPGGVLDLDLCEEDAAPLTKLLAGRPSRPAKAAAKRRSAPSKRSTTRSKPKLTTIDEIQAAKQA